LGEYFAELRRQEGDISLRQLVDRIVIPDNIPRYYVAAMFKTQADLEDTLTIQKIS
jgi:hypothetical protein